MGMPSVQAHTVCVHCVVWQWPDVASCGTADEFAYGTAQCVVRDLAKCDFQLSVGHTVTCQTLQQEACWVTYMISKHIWQLMLVLVQTTQHT